MNMHKEIIELDERIDEIHNEHNDIFNYLKLIKTELEKELDIKNRIIENLSKVIKSQEEEIHQLKKQDYTQSKRRAWHY